MTPTLCTLLAPAAVDPGTYTAEDLARQTGAMEPPEARHEVRLARRRGDVGASLLRLTAAGEAEADDLEGTAQAMERLEVIGRGEGVDAAAARAQLRQMKRVRPASHRRVLATLRRIGPSTIADAARSCGYMTRGGVAGPFKTAVDALVVEGLVLAPSGVVVTPQGCRAILSEWAGVEAVLAETHEIEGLCLAQRRRKEAAMALTAQIRELRRQASEQLGALRGVA